MIASVATDLWSNSPTGDLDDGEHFRRLFIWIEMYLETTEPHASQWWEMYHQERAIWEDFPSLVDGLLRRR